MLTVDDAVRAAHEQYRRTGGATTGLDGVVPTRGWAVSERGAETSVPGWASLDEVRAYANARRVQLDQPGAYLGVWFDTVTRRTYLDVAHVWGTVAQALYHAEEEEQRTVYGLAAGVLLWRHPDGVWSETEPGGADAWGADVAAA